MEQMQNFSKSGGVFTKGPGTYKIPAFSDIPEEFNVRLLKDSANTKAVHSSKAVGEPPLFLSASVFFAIREAIQCYRRQQGISESLVLHSPATAEAIRLACEDRFTEAVQVKEDGVPWVVSLES
jgi:xanthine dehydrogenase/oxidase